MRPKGGGREGGGERGACEACRYGEAAEAYARNKGVTGSGCERGKLRRIGLLAVSAGTACASCGAEGGELKLCGGCGMIKFCGAACAKEARKAHKHKAVCKAVKSGDWEVDDDDKVEAGGVEKPENVWNVALELD